MGVEGLGQIMAAAGAGALISSFLIASRKNPHDNGIPMIAGFPYFGFLICYDTWLC